jgi:phage tail-like protein
MPTEHRAIPSSCFKVEIADAVIGYFTVCEGLSVSYDVYEYAEGGQNDFVHQLRGHKKYAPLVLRRGATNEDALEKWFFQSKDREQRGAVTISLLDTKARTVRTWSFTAAFPVEWSGPTLSAASSEAAQERLVIAHAGKVMA